MSTSASQLADRNVRAFIAFRVFFNARFYYPVFAILFLDMGLTLEHFALLNVAWAATIVLLEVPSGALSDAIGRRRLVVASGILMVVEMSVLLLASFVPMALLFPLLLLNRVLSGAAEASASGADEALVYDALSRAGREDEWSAVLERSMRWQSLGFFFALLLGAAIYDPETLTSAARWLGWQLELTQKTTLRFPLILTWLGALLALVAALSMRSLRPEGTSLDLAACRRSLREATRITLEAGRWLLGHGFALAAVVAGTFTDSIARMFVTLNSAYYRLIGIPEAAFGMIGAGFALLGFATPALARRMAERLRPGANYAILGALLVVGFTGITLARDLSGLIFMAPLFTALSFTKYFLSFYLNRESSEERRATVLSFKSLAFNLGYGGIGVLYALWNSWVKAHVDAEHAFASGLWGFAAYAALGWIAVALWCAWRLRRGRL